VKPANFKENRRDRRLAENRSGKRRVVVVMRERGGRTLPAVFRSERAALGFIVSRVAPETKLVTDEAPSWNELHGRFDVARIDHGQAYSLDSGVYTMALKSFSAACAVLRSAIITISLAPIWSATPKSPHGAKIIVG
jgi:ISXO2-like transposase domain